MTRTNRALVRLILNKCFPEMKAKSRTMVLRIVSLYDLRKAGKPDVVYATASVAVAVRTLEEAAQGRLSLDPQTKEEIVKALGIQYA